MTSMDVWEKTTPRRSTSGVQGYALEMSRKPVDNPSARPVERLGAVPAVHNRPPCPECGSVEFRGHAVYTWPPPPAVCCGCQAVVAHPASLEQRWSQARRKHH